MTTPSPATDRKTKPAHRGAIAAAVGLVLALGLFLSIQWADFREARTALDVRAKEVTQTIRALEIVAVRLDEFKVKSTNVDDRLETLNQILPPKLEPQRVEEELRSVAHVSGVRVDEVKVVERKEDTYAEGLFTLSVTASRESAESFASRIVKARRLYCVDDISLPGPEGSIRVRAFAHEAAPRPNRIVTRAPPADPFPAWLFPLEPERQRVRRAEARRRELQVVERQVLGLEAREKLLADKVNLVERLRATAIPPVETELRASQLTLAELRVLELEARRARVTGSYGGQVELSAGDRLSNGVVTHVSPLGVLIEADLDQWDETKRRKTWLRYQPSRAAPPITVGLETTRITGPLLSDGTPDYGAWLNREFGAGVTTANNAAPLLREAMAGLVEGGQTFWDDLEFLGDNTEKSLSARLQSSPWSDLDCPGCATRLQRNEAPLARISEAARRSRHFTPQPTGRRLPLAIPSLLAYRRSANALAGRGMLRLGRGDLEGARQDALTIQRLAVLLSQGHMLIEDLIAVAIRGIGMPLLARIANAPGADANLARGLLTDLAAQGPLKSPADTLDTSERVVQLDGALRQRELVAERGAAQFIAAFDWRWPGGFWRERQAGQLELLILSNSNFDWDEVLRLLNRMSDLLVARLRARSPAERRLATSALQEEERRQGRALETLIAELGGPMKAGQALDRARALDEMARTEAGRRRLAALLWPAFPTVRVGIAWNEADTQFRIAVMSVALSVQRLESGRFPDRLEALLAAPSTLPGYTLTYVAAPGTGPTGAPPGTYALIAVPEEVGETGNRGFCLDSTGSMRSTVDGKTVKVVGGVCDPSVPLIR